MDISIVVPAFNEYESLPELFSWIDRVMKQNSFDYEIIVIDDGSTDTTWNVINECQQNNLHIKGVSFVRNFGKAAALHCGFERANGNVVITMDADMQDSPDEIPALYDMIMNEGYDLVSGWKKRRYDPLGKTLPSKLFNRTARLVSGIALHDFNCGLKAYRKKVVKNIEVYGEMHRYIPILAKKAGFAKIGEKVVKHQARKYGTTKYGLERMIKGYLDLITVTFLTRFSKSPMYIFGTMGTIMFTIGGMIALYILSNKLYLQCNGLEARPVTEQPIFFMALTMSIIGSQLFLAGLLAELVNRKAPERNNYRIDSEI